MLISKQSSKISVQLTAVLIVAISIMGFCKKYCAAYSLAASIPKERKRKTEKKVATVDAGRINSASSHCSYV